ncbi:MAG: septum site-determining protein MinD [Clostridiales bacterium]|jgi:septum site-determining protein MinD|nr:septum site-determining protein MinD [Clostridiales bacterium]
MTRAIVITSGKGGVGKTTVTANLGRMLACLGNKVVLLDTDIGLNNLDVIMGLENRIVYDIMDVIENRCRIKQALIEDEVAEGLFVLPSAHSYDTSKINGQNIKAVVRSLKEKFDYVLIDCPAGIEVGFHRAVSAADEAVVVTTPHISAIRDADKVIQLLKSYRLKDISFILNRVRGDMELRQETVGVDDVREILKARALGVVPEDDDINILSSSGRLPDKGSAGYDATFMAAKNLHYGTDFIYDAAKKYKGFFGSIKRRIKKRL